MFRIDYDPDINRITLHVSGFWTLEDVRAFAAATGAKSQEVRAVRGDYDVLVESLDFPVQANDIADLLTSVMTGGMTLTTGRAAVVVGSQLNRMQAERTLVHPRVRVFLGLAEAEAWLAIPDGAA